MTGLKNRTFEQKNFWAERGGGYIDEVLEAADHQHHSLEHRVSL